MVASLTNWGDLVMSFTFLARSGNSSCVLPKGEKTVPPETSLVSQLPSPPSVCGVTGTAEAWDPGVLIELLQD